MQPNELTLEAQMFDAKINSMDKTCLLAPLSFFDACNVSTDEERLRRMMLLRTRALQLGISEQEYADRRDNYTSQFDADPSYCLKIARMALRRQAMQELGFTPMADVETRQAEYLPDRAVSAAGRHHHLGRCGGHGQDLAGAEMGRRHQHRPRH